MTTSDEYDQAIGKAIKQAREMRGWSQSTFATRLSDGDTVNWHQQTILRLEAGQRSLKVRELLRVAEILDVSPLALLDGSIRTAHGKTLDRDDITWMIRDLGRSKSDIENALEVQREAASMLEPALQRMRHSLEVLQVDLVQRKQEEFRLYYSDGETDGEA